MKDGLYHKYNVTKADGSKVEEPGIFLKLTDPIATNALIQWGEDMDKEGYPDLQDDLLSELRYLGMIDELKK